MVEVKVLMELAKENDVVNKEGAITGEWVKISIRKCDIRKPIWYLNSGCSRHMTGVKINLHKYVEQPGPKWCLEMTLHAQIKVMALSNVMFDKKRGTIFNSNKEVVMIAPREKPCSSCEKGKHHRASFKTKQTSSIKKLLHLFHMDLFGPVTPRVFNTKRQQTKETYHITFDESPNAIKFLRPSVDNINIAETERYPSDEYLYPYESSQRFQIKQSKRGISINQEKYVKDLLTKCDINGSSVKTPMVPPNNLGPDLSGKPVNKTQYRDSDYAGCNMDRKSTSGACHLLRCKLMYWSAKKQQSVAMSSANAKFLVVARCCANILWIKS
nr:hypothetical protein [Tanacetum cinerariifolium]